MREQRRTTPLWPFPDLIPGSMTAPLSDCFTLLSSGWSVVPSWHLGHEHTSCLPLGGYLVMGEAHLFRKTQPPPTKPNFQQQPLSSSVLEGGERAEVWIFLQTLIQ